VLIGLCELYARFRILLGKKEQLKTTKKKTKLNETKRIYYNKWIERCRYYYNKVGAGLREKIRSSPATRWDILYYYYYYMRYV